MTRIPIFVFATMFAFACAKAPEPTGGTASVKSDDEKKEKRRTRAQYKTRGEKKSADLASLGCEESFNVIYPMTPTRVNGETDKGHEFDIDGSGDLGLSLSNSKSVYALSMRVDGANSGSVERRAEKMAKEESRETSFEPSYDDGDCLFVLANDLNDRNDDEKNAEINLNRSIPMYLNPNATLAHLKAAGVDEGVIDKAVTARGTGDDGDIYPDEGLDLEGDVAVVLIDHKKPVIDTNSQSTEYDADYAYRVSFDFKNVDTGEDTKIKFLNQEMDYYVKDGEIIGMVVHPKTSDVEVIVSEPEN